MNNILYFSNGDSNDPSVWSNVPYCFAKALEQEGYQLYRINLKSPKWLSSIWNRTIFQVLRRFKHGHLYSFERTIISAMYRRSVIWLANRKHPDISLSVFTGFDDINYFSKKPNILLCDWTLEYFIAQRLKRKPYLLEQSFIKRQNRVLKRADLVVSLFPKCSEIIMKQIEGASVNYLGGNVLNIIDEDFLDETDVLYKKECSNLILFIGNDRYISGAKKLLDAFKLLIKNNQRLELTFVGMNNKDLGIEPCENIKCFGYLHKDIHEENKTYYRLLRRAKIIVNTNEDWAGFSSMIEAMYYYTPVIVTPYTEFVEIFGNNIEFGLYDSISTAESLALNIESIVKSVFYKNMCIKAHEVTKSYTWEHYVRSLLNQINTQNR